MTKRQRMIRDYVLWFWRDEQFHRHRHRYPGYKWDSVWQEIKFMPQTGHTGIDRVSPSTCEAP
jgi:hypothetical protein